MTRQIGGIDYLRNNVKIGFVGQRGPAWWMANGEAHESHFELAVPMSVARDLLDWTPEPVTIMRESEDGSAVPLRDPSGDTRVAILNRTGDMLGIFTDGYPVTSYSERLLDGLTAILDDPDLSIGSVGLLDGGGKAWVQIETETLEHKSGEKFRPFLAAYSSLDGSLATTFKEGATRIQCDNTLQMFRTEKTGQYKYKNTRNSGLSIATAREALDLLIQTGDAVMAEMDAMMSVSVSNIQWDNFLNLYIPVPEENGPGRTRAINRQFALDDMYKNDSRVSDYWGTQWGAFQAVSTYQQHETTVRGKDNEYQRNMRKALAGDFAKEDAKVFELLTAATSA